MNFRHPIKLISAIIILSVAGCSDPDRENQLVDIFETAGQDVIGISFPAATETTVSINSQVNFTLQGLRSNTVDVVPLTRNVNWSLSAGAISSIDQNGLLTAASTAESITLTASFGVFTESLNILVSAAKFDRVVQLHDSAFSIDMCRSQVLRPVGRYVDENSNEEIRPVDSSIINTVEWIILNQEDLSPSQRAYVATAGNAASLHTLASGDLIIQARAPSVFAGGAVTSQDFSQTVGSALNSIKLCLSSAVDLSSCSATSARVEKDSATSFIAVGNYPGTDGVNLDENITRNSQWGISNAINASAVFSLDRERIDITGNVEDTTVAVSVACGVIEQSLAGIDITQGVNLTTPVSCGTNTACRVANSSINIDELTVLSFDVSANGIPLTDNALVALDARPVEISVVVNANFSNASQVDVTADNTLDYTIIADAQARVIEPTAGSPGTFTVLGPGTARIEIDYRNESFVALILVPF
jgi:hypothetical protein